MSFSLSAHYFDGTSSRRQVIDVVVDPEMRRIDLVNKTLSRGYAFRECTLRPPLGKTETTLELIDGGTVTFLTPESYAQLRQVIGGSQLEEWADALERRWRSVLASLGVLLLLGAVCLVWGLPWLARTVAFAFPDSATKAVSAETIRIMEATLFEPSKLAEERQEGLRRAFAAVLTDGGYVPETFDLRFRSSSKMGPNAFALPSGVIYLLDGLVELAEDDAEIIAVLAHEAGHVVERHGIQAVLRSTGIFLMISAMVGDVASITSLATALPAVLVDSKYSRGFESDADRFAVDLLQRGGRSGEPLGTLLLRLEGERGGQTAAEFMASHPATARRVRAIEGWCRSDDREQP